MVLSLSSGSRSGHIHHHDVRVADHHICTLAGHSQEVCGLQWSPDGRYLASGGNDNLVYVWPRVQEGGNNSQSVRCWSEHQGAVKVKGFIPELAIEHLAKNPRLYIYVYIYIPPPIIAHVFKTE